MTVTETWKKLTTEAILKGIETPFAATYVGLGVASFGVLGGDSPSGEIIGTNYGRLPVQWTDFAADMTNSNTLLWNVGSAWGTVGAVFVSDSSQGGAVLCWDEVTNRIFTAGDVLVIEAGSLVLT